MLEYLSSIKGVVGPLLDAMPHPVFLVDEDIAVLGLNRVSRQMIGENPELIVRTRAGEMLHCIHSEETEKGCGRSSFCPDCMVRNCTDKAFKENAIIRKKAKMEMVSSNGVEEICLSIIASPFEYK